MYKVSCIYVYKVMTDNTKFCVDKNNALLFDMVVITEYTHTKCRKFMYTLQY